MCGNASWEFHPRLSAAGPGIVERLRPRPRRQQRQALRMKKAHAAPGLRLQDRKKANKDTAAAEGRSTTALTFLRSLTAQVTVAAVHPPARLTRASTALPEASPRPALIRLAGGFPTNHQQALRRRRASRSSHWPHNCVARIGWKAPRPRERAVLPGPDSRPSLVPGPAAGPSGCLGSVWARLSGRHVPIHSA